MEMPLIKFCETLMVSNPSVFNQVVLTIILNVLWINSNWGNATFIHITIRNTNSSTTFPGKRVVTSKSIYRYPGVLANGCVSRIWNFNYDYLDLILFRVVIISSLYFWFQTYKIIVTSRVVYRNIIYIIQ